MNVLLTGTVVNGNKIGRRIGFPTANIPVGPETQLRNGVYTARVTLEGKRYGAVVNVGYKPTLGKGQSRMLEAHIFDFSGDIYGKTIEVELIRFLREEIRFASVEELRVQIEKDKQQALGLLRAEQR